MATGSLAERALEMAEVAVAADPDVYISIVGGTTFWASGGVLDTYIGELAQLRPAGWVVTVTRDTLLYPWPGLDPVEVEGVCRSVHGLSLRNSPVVMSHGDLQALPAIAAGGSHLGSGWDLRHRVCADVMFRRSDEVRRSSQRVTHRGLLASLKQVESESILQANPALSRRLVQGPLPPDFNAHWRHHLEVLTNRMERVIGAGDRQSRVQQLRRMYVQAGTNFVTVRGEIGRLEADRDQWIDPLAAGLDRYARGEGW